MWHNIRTDHLSLPEESGKLTVDVVNTDVVHTCENGTTENNLQYFIKEKLIC